MPPLDRECPLHDALPILTKAEKKGRTKDEVDEVIRWLTGYTKAGLAKQIEKRTSMRDFYEKAPKFNPNASLIEGVVCGIRRSEEHTSELQSPCNLVCRRL